MSIVVNEDRDQGESRPGRIGAQRSTSNGATRHFVAALLRAEFIEALPPRNPTSRDGRLARRPGQPGIQGSWEVLWKGEFREIGEVFQEFLGGIGFVNAAGGEIPIESMSERTTKPREAVRNQNQKPERAEGCRMGCFATGVT